MRSRKQNLGIIYKINKSQSIDQYSSTFLETLSDTDLNNLAQILLETENGDFRDAQYIHDQSDQKSVWNAKNARRRDVFNKATPYPEKPKKE
jgi:hypothetical protein